MPGEDRFLSRKALSCANPDLLMHRMEQVVQHLATLLRAGRHVRTRPATRKQGFAHDRV